MDKTLTRVGLLEYVDGIQRDKYRVEHRKKDDPHWYGICSYQTYEKAMEGLKRFKKNNPLITEFRMVKLSYSSRELYLFSDEEISKINDIIVEAREQVMRDEEIAKANGMKIER